MLPGVTKLILCWAWCKFRNQTFVKLSHLIPFRCLYFNFNSYTLHTKINKYQLLTYIFKVEVSEEYYAYDFTSFLADVGGNIGLLLGWSILSIIECFGEGLKEYMIKLWKRRHEN